ncbi:MAG: plastocyanin/azurin family copper-binding protein [Solirubrobacterales bacterium]
MLPAVAGSETSPTVEAVNGTGKYAEHHWLPASVSVDEAGAVTFTNPTLVSHGVHWVSVPATPVCSSGVPVGTSEAASAPEWSGSCTFTTPGTYIFYCTVHGAAMSGTVTVNAPATSTTPSTPAGATGTTDSGGGGSGQPGVTNGGGLSGPSGSPFAGGAGRALKLSRTQRGDAVRGSLAVSAAGARGRLEVDVLAKAASLDRAGQAAAVRVGKLERGSLAAGTVRFTVALNARAKRALARHGRLALTVEIALTPVGGSAAKIERGVVLRRPSHQGA